MHLIFSEIWREKDSKIIFIKEKEKMRAKAAQHSRRVSDQPHPSQRGGATLFARRANNGGGGVDYRRLLRNPLGSRAIAYAPAGQREVSYCVYGTQFYPAGKIAFSRPLRGLGRGRRGENNEKKKKKSNI